MKLLSFKLNVYNESVKNFIGTNYIKLHFLFKLKIVNVLAELNSVVALFQAKYSLQHYWKDYGGSPKTITVSNEAD